MKSVLLTPVDNCSVIQSGHGTSSGFIVILWRTRDSSKLDSMVSIRDTELTDVISFLPTHSGMIQGTLRQLKCFHDPESPPILPHVTSPFGVTHIRSLLANHGLSPVHHIPIPPLDLVQILSSNRRAYH